LSALECKDLNETDEVEFDDALCALATAVETFAQPSERVASEIALRSCPEAGRMERGLKACSAQKWPGRWLAGHATVGLEVSVGEGG